MPSEARQKKIMEKLNRAQKCSILGPQNLGSGGGGPGPPGPPPGSAPDTPGESLSFSFIEWHVQKKVEQPPPRHQDSLACNGVKKNRTSLYLWYRLVHYLENNTDCSLGYNLDCHLGRAPQIII